MLLKSIYVKTDEDEGDDRWQIDRWWIDMIENIYTTWFLSMGVQSIWKALFLHSLRIRFFDA